MKRINVIAFIVCLNFCPVFGYSSLLTREERSAWEDETIDYVDEDTDCEDLEYLCGRDGDGRACNGRGPCFCGECLCDPIDMARPEVRYSGKYCECPSNPEEYSCPYYRAKPCGGHERGECVCGECHCKPGYSGRDCRNEDEQR